MSRRQAISLPSIEAALSLTAFSREAVSAIPLFGLAIDRASAMVMVGR